MRLQDYWGVGPKTSERLRETLGVERAVEAIEGADIRTLADAGLPRGRAVRILRRANGATGMDALGTRDVHEVYDDLLTLASEYAVTDHASDRIRVLTPLEHVEAREERLDDVLDAREAWSSLDEDAKTAVLDAFDRYDEAGGTDRAAVEAALSLREAGLRGTTFDALDGVDDDALRDAAGALGYVESDGSVAAGADDELDRLRDKLDAVRELENGALDVLESVRSRGVRSLDEFQSAFVEYVAEESGLRRGRIEAATTGDAYDEADFASTTLRTLVEELEADVDAREESVAADLRADVEAARADVDAAVTAVSDIAFELSLGRFAAEYDLTRPTLVSDGVAVVGARNLTLSGDVDPVSYAVGAHELDSGTLTPPSGDRVAVLTGANSGGKTTLLETLCQVVLLASMGLPVPAESAEVGDFDTIVFHRRHASFNAGVLESTLKSIVPPLASGGRTLMLVDEFEAITEPGRAADLLNGLVSLTVRQDALGVYVTHLADELSPLPDEARIDGIFAEGLTEELALRVDYQPRFGTVGKSTPEFIVSRLVANARDRAERQGFEALAAAVGEEAIQQTL
ncbi:DNA mismatch repair protein, muts family [Halogeometricum borinquense DSM 11551]|uniref:DNA mismatch repair protein, MutS family n=2 Tax=Halogeometricum borinquense TaxID=60847 RepID=E4NNA5_HALBP|nr:DNA mismatch repair protein [Halogeometricum borinquense]ADQ67443.1 DNA mismatch repair protein, MutS family [Halogeometricum borinquense DSM 11551]ELY23282.1 DNA mismatch repair protein, muts family [Halogeometricum borinquense DSM 11551]RYJ14944.1 DNA mismatch repair protein [Halogeometricum borinquense]